MIIGVRDFDDAKEGSRFGSLKIVGEESWIVKVWEESAFEHLTLQTYKILTKSVKLLLQLQPSYVIFNLRKELIMGSLVKKDYVISYNWCKVLDC